MPDNTNRPPQWPNGEINVPRGSHESAQPCGCDRGANWTCEQHRVRPEFSYQPFVAPPDTTDEPCRFCQYLLKDVDVVCPMCGHESK